MPPPTPGPAWPPTPLSFYLLGFTEPWCFCPNMLHLQVALQTVCCPVPRALASPAPPPSAALSLSWGLPCFCPRFCGSILSSQAQQEPSVPGISATEGQVTFAGGPSHGLPPHVCGTCLLSSTQLT
ncbi:Hypothetical predicted protein [Marmota monax]|uniref:Uncharacterized protein n=1 Tax=Marmota monax TaxID=9995 RepID=A0A5E4C7P8_MARMO|nr:hypothetical protein GHT09_011492 [Marmota monax]VTJ77169.1 Hypothetical predicted protein [Marmota monax]